MGRRAGGATAAQLFDVLTAFGVRTLRRARTSLAERLEVEGATVADIEAVCAWFADQNQGHAAVAAAAAGGVLNEPQLWREVAEDVRKAHSASAARATARASSARAEPGASERADNMQRLAVDPERVRIRRAGFAYCRIVSELTPTQVVCDELRVTPWALREIVYEGAEMYGVTRDTVRKRMGWEE